MQKLGVYVFGLASLAAGVLDLLWGEFESAHQPIEAFGDHIPGVAIMAYVAAVWLIAGGAAIIAKKSQRFGAAALGGIYLIITVFWFPRLYTAPHFLGVHPHVYIGVLAGVCEELILVAGAGIVYAGWSPASIDVGRWVFGLGSTLFGLSHLTNIDTTAPLVPPWMPLGQNFWVVLTGIAFVLAGVAILTRVLDVLASWMLGLMLVIFDVLALAPMIVATPHDHVAWGGNAYNLTAVGAIWIFAGAIARRRAQ
jgi:uncharacterized membrane protein